jgi:hypothetical protein
MAKQLEFCFEENSTMNFYSKLYKVIAMSYPHPMPPPDEAIYYLKSIFRQPDVSDR